MTDYLQYWKPQRAALAFDNGIGPVRSLANGWFRNLAPGDTLWILTSMDSKLVLVLRAVVATSPVLLRKNPRYAVGNSKHFRNFEVSFVSPFLEPRAIPISMATLRRLRFTSTSARLEGPLQPILNGPLAAKKPLRPESVALLESSWSRRARYPWNDIVVKQSGRPVFATAEHRNKVEKASVEMATRYFEERGWTVKSRESDGIGYDLDCTKGRIEIHVEVKGTASETQSFFITSNEYRVMHEDRSFRLAVVTSALTKPKLMLLTGKAANALFRFTAIAYSAVSKS